MVKHVVLVTCLLAASLSAAASADSLLNPAQGICLASTATAPAANVIRCGPICDGGGTTPTQGQIGGPGAAACAAMTSYLTTAVTAAANSACMQSNGTRACSVVVHLTGCMEDGDPDYWIEHAYATYGCNDTTC